MENPFIKFFQEEGKEREKIRNHIKKRLSTKFHSIRTYFSLHQNSFRNSVGYFSFVIPEELAHSTENIRKDKEWGEREKEIGKTDDEPHSVMTLHQLDQFFLTPSPTSSIFPCSHIIYESLFIFLHNPFREVTIFVSLEYWRMNQFD